jgi:hypothetical protein
MPRESSFQSALIHELEDLFPNCIVMKTDCNYIQGFPDLLILFNDQWAALECKRSMREPFRPNQRYYLEILDDMSFASMICPENKEAVLYELQRSFSVGRPTCVSKR